MTKGELGLKTGACIALGIAVSVLLAFATSRERPGDSETLQSWPHALHGGMGKPVRQTRQHGLWATRDEALWRAETEFVPMDGDQSRLHYERVWSFGIPFRAIGYSEWYDSAKYRGVRSPWVPVWPGFALNTIFYAAIAWGLWHIPLAIRRRRRRAAHRCVRCGYALAGLPPTAPCPECATPQPPA